MDPFNKTAFNEGWGSGNNEAKASPFKRKYVATVYQGDTQLIARFQDSASYAVDANLPTGSICYINADGQAVAGLPVATPTNCPVPGVVVVGNDQKSVISQKGNIAGGIVTVLPCTGYYRIQTTVFDSSKSYAAGDYLTATTATFDGLSGVGLATKSTNGVYTDLIIGIVDKPVVSDHFDLPTLSFTCNFIPPQAAASSN